MDTARIRRELTGSLRLLWTEELWLYSGAVTVLAGFMLWVGATGAALTYGAEFAGIELSVIDWSSVTTVVFGLVVVIWIVAPAALVTYLVRQSLTNVSGNLHTHYRFQHPSLLLAPFLVCYAAGVGAGGALGTVRPALAAGLVALGLLVLIRTIAYSYRVFSLSYPLVTFLALFVSLALVAVVVLVGAGLVAGRQTFVEAAAMGVGDLLGTGGVDGVVLGTSTVGPVSVPTLLGVTAALPVAVSLLYVLLQSVAGLVARLRKPDVPRSRLRTGQRYPAFAHPISATAGAGGGGGSRDRSGTAPDTTDQTVDDDADPAPATAAGVNADDTSDSLSGADGGDSDADDIEDASHTRVYTAPDDGDFDGDVPGVDDVPDVDADNPAGGTGGETAVVGGDGYRCPTCSEQFESDTDFAYCPTCGTELEPE